MVVDPEPHEIYTKRKARVLNLPNSAASATSSVKYLSDDWGKLLERMPTITRAEMNQHMANSDKRVANSEYHSIPTNLRKVKTFLKDVNLKEIEANATTFIFILNQSAFIVSRRVKLPMIFVLLFALSQAVTHANFSCKAGKVGYFNHILALMFKACKFSLSDSKSTDDLCQDDHEQPYLACTSQLQKWHKKDQGDKISAQPVMEVTVSKTKLDEPRSREGVKCLIYDARCHPSMTFRLT